MSMKLMALAMDVKVGNPLRKLVLLKLCDNANDRGECWPSIQTIAEQCEISRRSVISHLQALADDGFVTIVNRAKAGEKISNLYCIDLSKSPASCEVGGANAAPGGSAGDALGSAGDALGSAGDALGGSAGAAHRTSHSLEPVNEPKKINTKKIAARLDWSSWGLPEQQVFDDWLALRKSLRAAVTQTVIDAFAVEFRKAERFGFSVSDCLRCAVVAGWRGFKFEWMQNRDRPGGPPGSPMPPRGGAAGLAGGATRDRSLVDDLTDRSWAK